MEMSLQRLRDSEFNEMYLSFRYKFAVDDDLRSIDSEKATSLTTDLFTNSSRFRHAYVENGRIRGILPEERDYQCEAIDSAFVDSNDDWDSFGSDDGRYDSDFDITYFSD